MIEHDRLGGRSISLMGIKLWNNLPPELLTIVVIWLSANYSELFYFVRHLSTTVIVFPLSSAAVFGL